MAYQLPNQSGKTFVISGANSGIGKEATKCLAHSGAEIIMAVRTLAKGEAAKNEILRQNPRAKLIVKELDVASLASIENFAENLKSAGQKIDVLINNAGVMAPPGREETKDGFELQIGTNFIGAFALTHHLLPILLKANAPRVTTMSSCGALAAPPFGLTKFRPDLQAEKRYVPFPVYARSKLADLVLSRELARVSREKGWKLLSNAAHPGVTHTNLTKAGANIGKEETKEPLKFKLMWLFAMSVEAGAKPLLQASTDPRAKAGSYYGPLFITNGPAKKVSLPYSERWVEKNGDARWLWEEAEKLTGLHF
ncbi:SDR family NAD(P)-dependent oxidoreductase [Acetobacteraceae bacterium]|nr:SDR family NAD(P)-dependent oxidoreductase [Acetobacteraceae bacterium]